MRMHLLEQASLYGAETLVNLVNHKGHEGPVKEAYERGVLGVCANVYNLLTSANPDHTAQSTWRPLRVL